MKYFIPLLLVIPTLCTGQYFSIFGGHQIDAEEIIVPDTELDNDELSYLLVNYKSDINISDIDLVNKGDYDFEIFVLESGNLFNAGIQATSNYEKVVGLNVSVEAELFFLDLVFKDSLSIDIDLDALINLKSNYGKSIANSIFDPEGEYLSISYLHNVDSTNIKATVSDGSYVVAGEFLDSVLFENPFGEVSSLYSDNPNNVFLANKTYDGMLNWAVHLETAQIPNVSDIAIKEDEIYLLTNDEDATMLGVYSLSDGTLLRANTWSRAILIDMELHDGNILLSGWVDTDTPIDLDFGPNETVLESGNDNDGVLLSYSDEMNLNWVQNISGSNRSHLTHFDIGKSGDIYAIGHVRGESIIGGIDTLDGSEDNHTLLISHFNTGGTYLGSDLYNGIGNNSASNILIVEENDLVTDLRVLATVTEELQIDSDNFQESFVNDTDLTRTYVFLELERLGTIDVDNKVKGELLIGPNPVSNYLEVITELNLETIEIHNSQGRLIEHFQNQIPKNIDMSSLMPGTYMIKLLTTDGLYSKSFIKI